MLKFIKHHMDTIAGIGIYPVVSFLLFFLIFLGVLLYVRRSRREHITYMAALPLGDGEDAIGSNNHAQP